MTYTDPRTGMVFATESIAIALGYGQPADTPAVTQPCIQIAKSASSPGGLDCRNRDASGKLTTNQENGSQTWMDASSVLNNQNSVNDPSMAEKAKASDAQYAYDSLVSYLNSPAFVDAYIRPSVTVAKTATTSPTAIPTDSANTITGPSAAASADVNTGGSTVESGGIVSVIKQYGIYIALGIIALIALGVIVIGGRKS